MPRPVSTIPSLISRRSKYQPCSDLMMVSFASGPLFPPCFCNFSLGSASSIYHPCLDLTMECLGRFFLTLIRRFTNDRMLRFSAWVCDSLFNSSKSNMSVLFQLRDGMSLWFVPIFIEYPTLLLLQGSPLGAQCAACACNFSSTSNIQACKFLFKVQRASRSWTRFNV